MESIELKKIVSELLREGCSLDEIQKTLASEHGEKITFFDLKMLVAELDDVDWGELEDDEAENEDADANDMDDSVDEPAGGTVVEISKLTRPGVALSGSVKFASGASAEWVLDQFGRIAFEKNEGKPTEQDIQEFQEQLKAKLSGGGR